MELFEELGYSFIVEFTLELLLMLLMKTKSYPHTNVYSL